MTKYAIAPIAINDEGARLRFEYDGKALSFREILDLWENSENAIQAYVSGIRNLGFTQFFWEHPAINSKTLDHTYEFMILKTEAFSSREIDKEAFGSKLSSEKQVEVFPNLGRNAMLVVPTIHSDEEHYKHLSIFMERAPTKQITELFEAIGKAMKTELKEGRPIWLSTAGLGVIWLHIRLDTTPKYYKTKTYKDPDFLR